MDCISLAKKAASQSSSLTITVPGDAPGFAVSVDFPDTTFPHSRCKVGFSECQLFTSLGDDR